MSNVINFAGTPVVASGNSSATVGRVIATEAAVEFPQLSLGLQGVGTKIIYLDPSGNIHNLAGGYAGLEGCRIATQVYGDQQWPFTQVMVNSPYIMGSLIQRQNIPERKFNFGIIIGGNPPMTEYQYRLAEDYWWSGQDESNDGWMGIYTRYSGWRWIPVRPEEPTKTPQTMDNTAWGNNVSRWDITWVAQRPYFTKPARAATFQSAQSGSYQAAPANLATGVTPGLQHLAYFWGNLPLANAGDLPSYVTYYVSSPGQAVVQDNSSGRLVPLPGTVSSVGTFMCDTEPGHRTLTAANDPTSNLVFDLVRQSTVLNYFLAAATSGSTPLQLQFQNRFIYAIPPRTEVTLTVGHSDPNGVVVAAVPQRYKRSR